jgi:hypothetical protein
VQIIGITGKARSGKDTIGKWFAQHRNGFVTHFAAPIKECICAAFSLPYDIWSDELKELPVPGLGKTPRYLAQTLGTEWGRNLVDGNVWLWAIEQRLRSSKIWYLDRCTIVIPDARFENEAKWIRDNGGLLLHVTRDGAGANNGVANHASEAGIAPKAGDLLIENNSSVVDLYERLDGMFPYEVYA